MHVWHQINETFANRLDPDVMLQDAASHQGLHSLNIQATSKGSDQTAPWAHVP